MNKELNKLNKELTKNNRKFLKFYNRTGLPYPVALEKFNAEQDRRDEWVNRVIIGCVIAFLAGCLIISYFILKRMESYDSSCSGVSPLAGVPVAGACAAEKRQAVADVWRI